MRKCVNTARRAEMLPGGKTCFIDPDQFAPEMSGSLDYSRFRGFEMGSGQAVDMVQSGFCHDRCD